MLVKFEQRANIDAPIETVWAIVSDPKTWPLWFAEVEQIANLGAVESGATFQWHKGGEVGTGSILNVNSEALQLQIMTQMDSAEVTHTFDVDRAGGLFGMGGNDARLKYTMEYDPPGGIVGDFIAGGNPADTLKVKHTLDKVRRLAEDQAGRG